MLDLFDANSMITRLLLALAIGLLVGLERGWRERAEPDGSRTAGIRTYGAIGLLGGVMALLGTAMNTPLLLIAGFLAFAAIFGWFKFEEGRHDGNFSVTGVVAALLVFALGALAVVGDQRLAAAGGAILAALLASREWLHGALTRLSWIELRSAIVLAVMTAAILPALPDRTIDPWGGLNPWEIWFFTVLTAAISFMGYVAVRLMGPARGLLVSGLAGAVMISILRVCGIVLIVQPQVLGEMIAPALAAAATFAVIGLALLFRSTSEANPPVPQNPFDLRALLIFALLFAVVSTLSAATTDRFGHASLLATSALSGTFDVDVAVLSALRLFGQDISPATIGISVLAALAANAVGRLSLATAAGPLSFSLPYLGASLLAALAGLVAYFVT
jgi:uncharacterized membrane protein (DUF4010 family)